MRRTLVTTTDWPRRDPRLSTPGRFDERGIALQTVIIMVVLLAIAGGVATVLFARANEATTQLDETEIAKIDYRTITSASLCESSGGGWTAGGTDWDHDGDPATDPITVKCSPPS